MQRDSTNRSGAVARRTTRAATQIPSSTAPRKPAAVSAPRAYSKPSAAYTDSDDDSDYSSSCSDNSEEYRPLAFALVKGGPQRKTGAPRQSKYSMRISQDAHDDSEFSLSDDEVPLTVTYENGAAKRKCGRVNEFAPTAKTMYGGASDTSSESECLPVAYTTGKRPRGMGRGVSSNGPEVTMEEAEVESMDAEDEMPLNTKLILNLVRRIRMNPKEIPLEAFAYVNWGDENYQEELKPLRRLYEELEAKARQVEKVKSAPQSTRKVDFDARIKEAVMALPQEAAILSKSKKIQSRQLRAQPGNLTRDGQVAPSKNAAMGVPASECARGQNQSVVSKPTKAQRQREKKMEASFGELGKLEGSALLARQPAKPKMKESTMSEAAKKVRRAGRQANRSTTFTDVVTPEDMEEIVEDQQANELPATSRAQSSVAAPISQMASRGVDITAQSDKPATARRAKRRGANGRDPGRSVSFADLPEDEVGELQDGPTDLRRGTKRKRRVAGKRGNNRSCSFSDVVIEKGDEVKEDDTGPGGQATRTSPAVAATADRTSTSKRRVAGGRGGTRTRDFTDAPMATGDEVAETNTRPRGTNAVASPASGAGATKPKHKQPRRSGLGRSRELSISCLDEVVAGEIHESMDDLKYLNRQAREIHTNATPSVRASRTPRASGSLRRPSMISQAAPIPASKSMPDDVVARDEVVLEGPGTFAGARATRNVRARKQRKHMSQELSFSAIPDDDAGEIREQHTDKISEVGGPTPSTSRSGPLARGSLPRMPTNSQRSSAANSAAVPTAQTTRLKSSADSEVNNVRTSASSARRSK